MNSREQARLVIQAFEDEKERRKHMSPEERRESSKQNLINIGIIDENGNVMDPYKGVFVRAQ